MAKKMYIGTNNLATQVKKMYVGVNGVAKKVKKGYVGVSGVAKMFFGGRGLPTYNGTAPAFTTAKYEYAAASVGNYALFVGGSRPDGVILKSVEAYDNLLTKVTADSMSTARSRHCGISTPQYAYFLGGLAQQVEHYNSSLTRAIINITVNYSSAGFASSAASTCLGELAIFGGGSLSGTRSAYVHSFYNGTSSQAATLSTARSDLAAATVGNYALFAGGMSTANSSSATAQKTVDAFDTSLTRFAAPDLSGTRSYFSAETVGNFAVFCGNQSYLSAMLVDAYDGSLTRVAVSDLPAGVRKPTAASFGDYALFCGGYDASSTETALYSYPTNLVNVFDESLTHSYLTELSVARAELGATLINDYILVGGGKTNSSGYSNAASDVVDVYTLA